MRLLSCLRCQESLRDARIISYVVKCTRLSLCTAVSNMMDLYCVCMVSLWINYIWKGVEYKYCARRTRYVILRLIRFVQDRCSLMCLSLEDIQGNTHRVRNILNSCTVCVILYDIDIAQYRYRQLYWIKVSPSLLKFLVSLLTFKWTAKVTVTDFIEKCVHD